jgi:hypothetical protein
METALIAHRCGRAYGPDSSRRALRAALAGGPRLEAEQQFRKIIGYTDLAKLAIAVQRDLAAQRAPVHPPTIEEAATLATA